MRYALLVVVSSVAGSLAAIVVFVALALALAYVLTVSP